MSTLLFGDQEIDTNGPLGNAALHQAHITKTRPFCLCISPPPEMYVAKFGTNYFAKRMPGTGSCHAPSCDSYETPSELSGLGQVIGTAIQEDTQDGLTNLKFSFSLAKAKGRAAPAPSGAESDSVKTDGNKLTLRGTLHYLWEQASFNKWTPAMQGKRSYYVLRKYLLQSAESKTSKGQNLNDLLFIPESFSVEKKAEINNRRSQRFLRASVPSKTGKQLILAIGEVKEILPARYGQKMLLKHMADFPLMLNDDIHNRMRKRFDNEFAIWNAVEGTRLISIFTFGLSDGGIATVEEIAVMNVTESWIPFENLSEKIVIDEMTREGMRFTKCLRYNLHSHKPLASFVVTGTDAVPTAMYVIPPSADDDYLEENERLMSDSKLKNWLWLAGKDDMPPLPLSK